MKQVQGMLSSYYFIYQQSTHSKFVHGLAKTAEAEAILKKGFQKR